MTVRTRRKAISVPRDDPLVKLEVQLEQTRNDYREERRKRQKKPKLVLDNPNDELPKPIVFDKEQVLDLKFLKQYMMKNQMHDDSADKVRSLIPNFEPNEELENQNNFFNKNILPSIEIKYQEDDMKIWQ